jgi:hypothetical protein
MTIKGATRWVGKSMPAVFPPHRTPTAVSIISTSKDHRAAGGMGIFPTPWIQPGFLPKRISHAKSCLPLRCLLTVRRNAGAHLPGEPTPRKEALTDETGDLYHSPYSIYLETLLVNHQLMEREKKQ